MKFHHHESVNGPLSLFNMSLLYFKYILDSRNLFFYFMCGQCKMKTVDCGLQTADCRLQPGLKCRLQTEDWIMLQFPSLRATAVTINRLTGMLFRLTWVIFRLTSVIFRLTGMQTFTVIRMFMVRGAIRLCSGSKRCRWIHNHLVIRRHVWECDNKSVAHGLPYLEILKGW